MGIVTEVKKGSLLGPTSPPNCHVACPYATTSISVNLNMELYFVHEERKIYKRVQVIPVLLEIHYRKPNTSNTVALLPLSERNLPCMVLLATR